MQFTRLRLRGFKSFVDPTDLLIEPGMTGIVGPNGCGKSNIVEALRWVMGETSAKRMRGAEMDDVIFAGSDRRPQHNIAEVAVHLDNAGRTAPAQFNDLAELDVVRRIERDRGSTYRVNGKEVRARDVQLLFADQATGASATALVSQGRVGHLINAKPSERRHLLEEAAGITGLHSRRHEAELRLRAAESNLERLEDVFSTLSQQLDTLQRQARQAKRYRDLSRKIRHYEAILLHLLAESARAELSDARARLQDANAEVEDLTRRGAAAATAQAEAQAALPELRETEAAAAAEVQRYTLARQTLDQEETQVADAKARAEERLAQMDGDLRRADEQKADASAAVARLETEDAELRQAAEGETEARTEARAARDRAKEAVEASERELADHNQKVATDEARLQSLDNQVGAMTRRAEDLRRKYQDAERQRGEAADDGAVHERALEGLAEAVSKAQKTLTEAGDAVESAEADLSRTRAREQDAHAALQAAEGRLGKLQAEIDALSGLLAQPWDSGRPPVIEAVRAAPGSEAALGAALGDDLNAPLDSDAPVHWLELPPIDEAPPLPGDVVCLADFVSAPPALRRRMSFVGVVEDPAVGHRLQSALLPGQRLVSRDGDLWRWDGYVSAAEAPTAAAQRLEQQNRLSALREGLPDLEEQVNAARDDHAKAAAAARTAAERDATARRAVRDAQAEVERARSEHARVERAVATARSRLTGLDETLERLAADIAEAESAKAQAEAERETIPDTTAARAEVEALRATLAERRAELSRSEAALDQIARDAEARARRRESIAAEMRAWVERASAADQHAKELRERRAGALEELETLAAKPAEISAKREKLSEYLATAELARQAAADALAEGETRLAEADRRLKAEETRIAEAREARVRAEARVERAEADLESVRERVRDRLDCDLSDILSQIELPGESSLPDQAEAEEHLQRLVKQRDGIGPVNLRAESEAEELDKRISELRNEREDLTAAIARLRQGIATINREGRDRLTTAFEHVNTRFGELFRRLFGGGRAHLALVESDDPLAAGLEIMASPPGKRLQTMSLLSGGEQALTALALLFAVFLTNPAPICVLDEVDAPLDDANVDRFCSLVSELSRHGETRFLVVTHHRMTMSRMDRLFGVTMSERGVSQLVSVDLSVAEALRESA